MLFCTRLTALFSATVAVVISAVCATGTRAQNLGCTNFWVNPRTGIEECLNGEQLIQAAERLRTTQSASEFTRGRLPASNREFGDSTPKGAIPAAATHTETVGNLRYDLEVVYEQLRAAIHQRDFNAFRALIDQTQQRYLWSQLEFNELVPLLEWSLPPLSATRFFRVEQSGDWAAYYYQENLNEPTNITLTVHRFHKTAARWKFHSSDTDTILTSSNQPETLSQLYKETRFRLPGQPGFDAETWGMPAPASQACQVVALKAGRKLREIGVANDELGNVFKTAIVNSKGGLVVEVQLEYTGLIDGQPPKNPIYAEVFSAIQWHQFTTAFYQALTAAKRHTDISSSIPIQLLSFQTNNFSKYDSIVLMLGREFNHGCASNGAFHMELSRGNAFTQFRSVVDATTRALGK